MPIAFLNHMKTGHTKSTVKRDGKKRKKEADLAIIRGIVIPVDWDEEGNVVAGAISTYHEDEYLIDKDEKGNELLAFIRKEVEVNGIILREQENRPVIIVREYSFRKGDRYE